MNSRDKVYSTNGLKKRIVFKKIIYHQLFLVLCIVTLIFFVLYYQFIIGDKYYIYGDIGLDTIHQYWPKYLMSLESLGKFNSGYTLQKGLGSYINNIVGDFMNPFDWVFFFIKSAHGLIISLYLKMIWTTCFAWAYFRRVYKENLSVIVCTILWTFNGWMLLWGQHYQFATSFAYITANIFLLRLLLEKNKYGILLPAGLALLTSHSYYMTYMFGIFSICYIVIFGINKKRRLKEILLWIVQLGLAEVLAILVSAMQVYPMIESFFNSARTDALNISLISLFSPKHIKYLICYLGRMLSSNIWGISKYSGCLNYYEMAISYTSCLGIFAIIYFLQTKYWKKIFLFLIILVAVILFPFSSMLLTFSSDGYRWSFIINFVITLFVGFFLNKIVDDLKEKKKIRLYKTLIFSNIVLACILGGIAWISIKGQEGFSGYSRAIIEVICAWLVIDVLLLIYMRIDYNKKILNHFIILFVCFETILMNFETINNRFIISKWELENTLYNDGTSELVEQLKKEDSSLYRINKTYNSVFYNDAYAQGYYGVESYDSTHNKHLIELFRMLEIPLLFDNVNYLHLDWQQKYVNELFGVKYVISTENEQMPDDYEKVLDNGTKNVYKDTNNLPFGYLYNTEISKGSFTKLSGRNEKAASLMCGFFFTDLKSTNRYKTFEITDEEALAMADQGRKGLQKSSIHDITFLNNEYTAIVDSNESISMLCVPLGYDKKWKATIDDQKAACYNINGGMIGIEIPSGIHRVNIKYDTANYVKAMWVTIVTSLIYIIILILYFVKNHILETRREN